MNKKISTFVVAALIMAAVAHAQVVSKNIVGFQKVTLPEDGAFIQVGLQFDPFDPTLEGVLGTDQLRANRNPSLADSVYIWDPSVPEYKRYAIKESDMKWHLFTAFSGDAVNPPLTAGMAMWIQSAPGTTEPLEITIMGQAVSVVTQKIDIVSGFQMVAYPFTSSIGLQDLNFANNNATADRNPSLADSIYVWKDGAYKRYALKESTMMWHDFSSFSSSAVVTNLDLGQGFWYEAKAPITWSETNRYMDAFAK